MIALTILGLLLGYFLGAQREPSYEAVARLFLSDPRSAAMVGSNARPALNPEQYVPQQTERVTSRPVLERAVEELGGGIDPDGLRRSVTVVGEAELGVISIVASAGTPEAAADRANALAAAYQSVTAAQTLADARAAVDELEEAGAALRATIRGLERELQLEPDDVAAASQLEAFNEQLLSLQIRGQEVLVEAAVRGSGVDLLETAQPSDEPAGYGALPFAVLLGLLGASAGTGIAYWRAGRGRIAESHQEPGRILGAPLLGEVPEFKPIKRRSLAERLAGSPQTAEAFQLVLASMELALSEIDGRLVLVTSALPGEGKTTAALQLGIAAARDERSTLLIDADVRALGVTQEIESVDRPGLVQLAQHGALLRDAIHRVALADGGELPTIPAGGQHINGAVLFRSDGFGRALAACREAFGLVFIDSPPVLSVADTLLIASHVDAIVVVVSRGTLLQDLERLRDRLAFVPTPVLGYVYNRSAAPLRSTGYGYAHLQPGDRSSRRRSASWRPWKGKHKAPSEGAGPVGWRS